MVLTAVDISNTDAFPIPKRKSKHSKKAKSTENSGSDSEPTEAEEEGSDHAEDVVSHGISTPPPTVTPASQSEQQGHDGTTDQIADNVPSTQQSDPVVTKWYVMCHRELSYTNV